MRAMVRPDGNVKLERQLAVQYAIARAVAEADRLDDIAGLGHRAGRRQLPDAYARHDF
jgi:hypothetical protein